MRQFFLAAALAACVAPPVAGQENDREIKTSLAWTSVDGGFHFTVPAGWQRASENDKGIVLDVFKSDPTKRVPRIDCEVRITPMGRIQPNATQGTISAKIGAGAGLNLEERKVRSVDDVAVVEGIVPVKPHIAVEMLTAYVRGDEGHAVNVICRRDQAAGLTSDNLAAIRLLLNSVSFTH